MAGIWRRGSYWRVEIRRVGYPNQNRIFDTKADAEAWARQVESEMDPVAEGPLAGGGCRNEHVRPLDILVIETALRRGKQPFLRWPDVLLMWKLRSDLNAALKVFAPSDRSIAQYRNRHLAGDSNKEPLTAVLHPECGRDYR